jgi:hypothetical protein
MDSRKVFLVLFSILLLIGVVQALVLTGTDVTDLPMNGTAGSTTFYDLNGSMTWTAGGLANISNTFFEFGGGSGAFAGTAGGLTNLTNTTPTNRYNFLHNGAYPWTVQFWANSSLWSNTEGILDDSNYLSEAGIVIQSGATNTLIVYIWNGVGVGYSKVLNNASYFNSGTGWHFYQIQFNGTAYSCYVDGNYFGQGLALGSYSTADHYKVIIGSVVGAYPFQGYLDDFVISNAILPHNVPGAEYGYVPYPTSTISFIPSSVGVGNITTSTVTATVANVPAVNTIQFNATFNSSEVNIKNILFNSTSGLTGLTMVSSYSNKFPSGWFGVNITGTNMSITSQIPLVDFQFVAMNFTNHTAPLNYGSTPISPSYIVTTTSAFFPFTNQNPGMLNTLQQANISLELRDITTLSLVPASTVIQYTQSDGTVGTTTAINGYANITGVFLGALTINIAAQGMYQSYTTVVSVPYGFTDYIIYLTPVKTSQDVWYTPHQVEVTIMDTYGMRLPGVSITANYMSSTIPIAWLTSLYGMQTGPAGDTINKTLNMNGVTGSDGVITFTMVGSLFYCITLNSGTYGLANYNTTAYPLDSALNIYVIPAGQQIPNSVNSSYQATNGSTLYFYEPDINHVMLCTNYSDYTGATTNLQFKVWFANNGTVFNLTNVASPGAGIYNICNNTVNIRGTQMFWSYNGTRTYIS